MTMTAEQTAARDALLQHRRVEINAGHEAGLVGQGIVDTIETVEEARAMVLAAIGGKAGATLADVLALAAREIERLTHALLLVANEVTVPDAFPPEDWNRLDPARQLHVSALVIVGAVLATDVDDEIHGPPDPPAAAPADPLNRARE